MDSLAMPEEHAYPSTAADYGYIGYADVWAIGGKAYEAFKKNDELMGRYLSRGFVETNGEMPWTCVFSDLTELQIDKYGVLGWRKDFRFTHLDKFNKKIAALDSLLHMENNFRDSDRKYMNIDWPAWESCLDEIASMHYINLGATRERDYTSMGHACYLLLGQVFGVDTKLLLSHNRDAQDDARDKISKCVGDGVGNFLFRNMSAYISWIIAAGNEAQKYSSYARSHPSKEMVKQLYAHEFTKEAIDIMAKSWTGKAFYLANTVGIDWADIFNKRAIDLGLNIQCPV